MGLPDVISDFAYEVMTARAQAVETACEAAIQSGLYGVRVRSGWQGTGTDLTYVTEAWVDPTVPYGRMIEEASPPLTPRC